MKLLDETLNIMRGNLCFSIRIMHWKKFRETLTILDSLNIVDYVTLRLVSSRAGTSGQFDGLVIDAAGLPKLPSLIIEGRFQCDIEYIRPNPTLSDLRFHVPIKEWTAQHHHLAADATGEFVLRRYNDRYNFLLLLASQQGRKVQILMPLREVFCEPNTHAVVVTGNTIQMPRTKLTSVLNQMRFGAVDVLQFDLELTSDSSTNALWVYGSAFDEHGTLSSHAEQGLCVETGVHGIVIDQDAPALDSKGTHPVASGRHLVAHLHKIMENTTDEMIHIVLSKHEDTKKPGLCRVHIPFGQPGDTQDFLSFTYHPNDLHFSMTFAHANLANLLQILHPYSGDNQSVTIKVVCDPVSNFEGVLMGDFAKESLFFAVQCEHVQRFEPFGCEFTMRPKALLDMIKLSREVKRLTLVRKKGDTTSLCVTAFCSDSGAQPAWRANLQTIWK
jgi:hypothetical protein